MCRGTGPVFNDRNGNGIVPLDYRPSPPLQHPGVDRGGADVRNWNIPYDTSSKREKPPHQPADPTDCPLLPSDVAEKFLQIQRFEVLRVDLVHCWSSATLWLPHDFPTPGYGWASTSTSSGVRVSSKYSFHRWTTSPVKVKSLIVWWYWLMELVPQSTWSYSYKQSTVSEGKYWQFCNSTSYICIVHK